MSFTHFFFAAAALSLAASAAYGFYFLTKPPTLARAFVKTLAIVALAGAVYALDVHPLLVIVLALSAIGDFFLALQKGWSLIAGIVAFLFAQLVYVAIFFALWLLGQPLEPLWARHAMLAALLIGVLVFLFWLWSEKARPQGKPPAWIAMLALIPLGLLPILSLPLIAAIPMGTIGNVEWTFWAGLGGAILVLGALVFLRRDVGAMKIGVMPYVMTLTAMAALTLFGSWASWPAMLGAALFVISDALIAAEFFKLAPESPHRRWTAPAIWWTYYAAQILLITGIILGWRSMA
ncbi:MAG: lysoplasmalogenase family protein [Hyphomonadaceae bacterium]